MDEESYFGKYSLSSGSLEKLKPIQERLKKFAQHRGSNAWSVIKGEPEEEMILDDSVENPAMRSPKNDERPVETIQEVDKDNVNDQTLPATQFCLTQTDTLLSYRPVRDGVQQLSDITESLLESLDRNNGKFDVSHIRDLADSELSEIIDDLSKKLGPDGVFNLCHSICKMGIEQRMRYVGLLCTNLLLPMLIDMEKYDRKIDYAIRECVETFPEDVQKFIFFPILNAELKDSSAILTIINSFDNLKRQTFVCDFSTRVKDLKQWHIPILQKLLKPNLDESTKDRLVKLLSDKSFHFCKDTNYGQLVLNLLKTNPPFTEQQVVSLEEIATLNNTVHNEAIRDKLNQMTNFIPE